MEFTGSRGFRCIGVDNGKNAAHGGYTLSRFYVAATVSTNSMKYTKIKKRVCAGLLRLYRIRKLELSSLTSKDNKISIHLGSTWSQPGGVLYRERATLSSWTFCQESRPRFQ